MNELIRGKGMGLRRDKAPNFIPCPSGPRRLLGGRFLLDDFDLDGQLYVVADHG